jgi:hypothetical protein
VQLTYMNVKMTRREKPHEVCPNTYWGPDEEQARSYNMAIAKGWQELVDSRTDLLEAFVAIIKQAAKDTLREKPAEIKQLYITQATQELIQEKNRAVEAEHRATVESLKKDIDNRAREDEQNHTLTQFEKLDTNGTA